MKHTLVLFITAYLLILSSCKDPNSVPMYESFDEYPVYNGDDLGLTYSPTRSVFKSWSPPALEARLHIYESGSGDEVLQTIEMQRGSRGVWEAIIEEDLKGKYYTLQVNIDGEWLDEVPDPYAKAVGVNGKRGMVVDLIETNPEGWENDRNPPLENFTDIIIYELHIRDLSMHDNSGIRNKGKFLGLTETGTKSPQGEMTGIDHIADLGVTHVHLLPVYDFYSIDESKLGQNKFNWGYDPLNYNTPEGSYSTNPHDGAVRIREFKQAIKALHDKGLRVIMDVVYNHTGPTEGSNFNQLVPGYYYRQDSTGGFSNASACGNETASERAMMRKFIIESVTYWAKEYHINGFRFDLMGIHDIETMNQISKALHKIDPTIFIYGEGWTAGESPLPIEQQALKQNTKKLKGVAAFSDDIRDGIKGHVFTHDEPGFVSAKAGLKESVKFGVVAATRHPHVDYKQVNYSKEPWANDPVQTITYVSCHDNHTLWDRLDLSQPDATEAERIAMHKLAGAIVLTSQGISFLHAGVEMARTKSGVENSFESSDRINRIDWSRKTRYKEIYDYYKGLIKLRKNHPAFRMTSSKMTARRIDFLEWGEENVIGYTIYGHANGDPWEEILVIFNGSKEKQKLEVPEGPWTIVVNDQEVNEAGLGKESGKRLTVPPSSAMVMYKN